MSSRSGGEKPFAYMCERCFDLMLMRPNQYRQAVDHLGRLYCDECKAQKRRGTMHVLPGKEQP